MSELLFGFSQHVCDSIESFSCVYLTGRVVWIVYKYRLDLRHEQLSESLGIRIKMKLLIGRDHNCIDAPITGPVAVFYEIWREHCHLVARIRNAPEYHIDTVSGAAIHNDMIYIKVVSTGSFVKVVCDGFSCGFVSGI